MPVRHAYTGPRFENGGIERILRERRLAYSTHEPIVCRPDKAVDCFLRTRMDTLAIGYYLVVKEP